MSCSLSQLSNTVYLPIETPPLGTELRWAPKDPGDDAFRTFDLTQYLLQTNDSLSVVQSVVLTPDDMQFTQSILTSTAVTWLAEGGTFTNPPTDYYAEVTLLTTLGQKITRKIYMVVLNLSLEWISGSPIAVLQGPPGPAPTAAQIVAAFQTIPFQSAGIPVNGFWISTDGNIQLAPTMDFTIPTYANLRVGLAVLGLI